MGQKQAHINQQVCYSARMEKEKGAQGYQTIEDRERTLLDSPSWGHRKINLKIKPFKKDVQFDQGIDRLQKKATKVEPIKKLNLKKQQSSSKKLSHSLDNFAMYRSQVVPRPSQNFQEYLKKELQIFKEESLSEVGSDDFEHYVDHKKRVSNLGYNSPALERSLLRRSTYKNLNSMQMASPQRYYLCSLKNKKSQ